MDGVEAEVVFGGHLEHAEVDGGIFVAGEADEAAFAGLLGFVQGFDGAAFGEGLVGVFEADAFVELPEVEVVGLEAAASAPVAIAIFIKLRRVRPGLG